MTGSAQLSTHNGGNESRCSPESEILIFAGTFRLRAAGSASLMGRSTGRHAVKRGNIDSDPLCRIALTDDGEVSSLPVARESPSTVNAMRHSGSLSILPRFTACRPVDLPIRLAEPAARSRKVPANMRISLSGEQRDSLPPL